MKLATKMRIAHAVMVGSGVVALVCLVVNLWLRFTWEPLELGPATENRSLPPPDKADLYAEVPGVGRFDCRYERHEGETKVYTCWVER